MSSSLFDLFLGFDQAALAPVGNTLFLAFTPLFVHDAHLAALAHAPYEMAFAGSARIFHAAHGDAPRMLGVTMLERSTSLEAVPPMWNVRMVSCVPGSPMDWAAMMPTVSPIFTLMPSEPNRGHSICAHTP